MRNEIAAEKIGRTYERLGRFADLYDGMMANSSVLGRLAMRFFWRLSDADYQKFLQYAFAGIPENFAGNLLEVPLGTGILSLPVYKKIPAAKIIGVDYSSTMLAAARKNAQNLNLRNVEFVRGDVGNLPFADETFEIVLSINGLHVFPDKTAAYGEMFRVLKTGGIFCGSLYVAGENRWTDFFVRNFCARRGYFTAPFETAETLCEKLGAFYSDVKISAVQAFAGFVCRK